MIRVVLCISLGMCILGAVPVERDRSPALSAIWWLHGCVEGNVTQLPTHRPRLEMLHVAL